jgi:2-iminobutanoate/2-iminopropanoate deaminase
MIIGMRFMTGVLILATVGGGFGADTKNRQVIQPKEFPSGRPFSPGILVDGTLYVAGQTGSDLKTGQRPEDFEAEVRTALDNIGLVLREAKMDYSSVVAVQVYLTDMDLFPRMNAIYTTYFKDPRPVRTTVGVAKLVGTARIEITVTAHK